MDAADGGNFDSVNTATGEIWCRIPEATAEEAGIIWVNTYRAISPITEFGGMKGSGYGREGGFQAIYDYTRPKTVWMNTSDEPLGSQFVAR